MNEYIYKLILEDRLFTATNWTENDELIITKHVEHLQLLLQQNRLVIAGKTAGLSKDTYGIVIFTANDMVEAQSIMNDDPAIKNGIMTGYLQEYNIAFYNTNYEKE